MSANEAMFNWSLNYQAAPSFFHKSILDYSVICKILLRFKNTYYIYFKKKLRCWNINFPLQRNRTQTLCESISYSFHVQGVNIILYNIFALYWNLVVGSLNFVIIALQRNNIYSPCVYTSIYIYRLGYSYTLNLVSKSFQKQKKD